MTEQQVWTMAACAALGSFADADSESTSEEVAEYAAKDADALVVEWRKRYMPDDVDGAGMTEGMANDMRRAKASE